MLSRNLIRSTVKLPATTNLQQIAVRGTVLNQFSTLRTLNNRAQQPSNVNLGSTSTATPVSGKNRSKWGRNLMIFGAVSGLFIGYKWYTSPSMVSVYESLKPYPVKLTTKTTPYDTNYTLLGSGVRTLSVSTYKVYAMGVYVADADEHLIAEILDTNFLRKNFIDLDYTKSHSENIKIAMNDPVKSEILVNALFDAGVRLLINLTPIIKSNMTFVREGGIVKALKVSPHYKDSEATINKGINEIRKAFTHKGSLAINDNLALELKANNAVQFYYYNDKNDRYVTMGTVQEPLVGKLLFGAYLAGEKPLCPEAKDDFTEKIASMV